MVVPSTPGFGFSGPTRRPGRTIDQMASAWAELKRRLGQERNAAHGADLGVGISLTLAKLVPDHLVGAHMNFLATPPSGDPTSAGLTEPDRERLAMLELFVRTCGHSPARCGPATGFPTI